MQAADIISASAMDGSLPSAMRHFRLHESENRLSGHSGDLLAIDGGCILRRRPSKLVEQRLGVFQIGRVETLGEPAIDGC
jgi:hypothetical protein